MKKIWIGAIISVAFVCSVLVYTEWDKRRFMDSLPQPPVVEQIVNTHTDPHLHTHDDPVPTPHSNTVRVDSEPGGEENIVATSTNPMSEEDTLQIDEEEQTEAALQSPAAWHTDDEHAHQSNRSPFARKITRVEDMDPDELADMTLVSLLQQFGDIPEVHTFTELSRKKFKNEPLTLDEHIDFTRAQYALWPDPRTKKTLEVFLEEKASQYPNSTKIVR
ncbi:MAG: hypothetical protein OXG97_08685 [Candidatus Poribacteria bacterium]|nr:hypothetical protein [Candidatus Poribacteria bacterium]